jgi:hypothetical protein
VRGDPAHHGGAFTGSPLLPTECVRTGKVS